MSYLSFQKFSEKISSDAVALLKTQQYAAKISVRKDEKDFATDADIASEQLIIKTIQKKFPQDSILSEEIGAQRGVSERTWVIDPLDGTKEYASGLSEWGCLIAVEEKGKVVAGAANLADSGVLYSSALGGGPLCNGQKIHVSAETMKTAIVSLHLPIRKNTKEEIRNGIQVLERLIGAFYRVRAEHFDAKAFGKVARGIWTAHIVPPHLPKWWDVASSLLLVEEAGGEVTDWEGKPIKNRDLSHGIVASNGKIHEELLKIIKEAQ